MLCEDPILGMPTENGMYVLHTDASVLAISGILHQEQEWNGKIVLRPIAYGNKVLSDTEMKKNCVQKVGDVCGGHLRREVQSISEQLAIKITVG